MNWSRPAPNRKNRSRSIHGKAFAVLLVLLAFLPALALGISAASPWALERFIAGYMQDLGIEEPEIRVDSIGLRGVHLSDIRGKNLGVEVDRVGVRLDWSNLMQGKAARIVVTGLNWRINYSPEGLDTGLPFKGRDRDDQLAIPALPFEVLELQSSSFLIQYAGMGWRVPLRGTIHAGDVQDIRAEFDTRLLGSVLHIKGGADLVSGWADIAAQSSWPGDDPPENFPDRGLPLKALLSLKWAGGMDDPGKAEVDFLAELGRQHLSLGDRDIQVDKAGLYLSGAFAQGFSRERLQAEVHLEGLQYGDFNFSGINMLLQDQGGFSLKADLEKPGQMKLDLSGSHDDLFSLWREDMPWSGQWDISLGGHVTPELARVFLSADALVQKAFPVQASGTLKAGALRDADGLDWQASLDLAKAAAGPLDVHLPGQQADIKGIFLDLSPQISVTPGLTTAGLGRGSRLGFSSMSMALEDDRLEVPGLIMDGGKNWAGLELKAEEPPRVKLDASLPGGLVLKSRDARASFASGALQADLKFPEGRLRGGLTANLSGGGIKLEDIGLELAGISLGLPVSWDSPVQTRGRWKIEDIYYSGVRLPGPEGNAAVADYRLQADGTWEVFPGVKADLGMDFSLGDRGISGRAKAGTDWFNMPPREYLQDFLPLIKDFEVKGLARLDMHADLDSGGVQPCLQLELDGVDVRGRDMNLAVKGISGVVALDSLDPLHTARDRDSYVHVQELETDILTARDGLTSFRVRGDTLLLDKSSWLLVPRGRVSVYSSRWNLEAGQGLLDMYFEDVDLLEYAGRAFQDKIHGSGLFYGHLHVGMDSERISLGEGYIYSLPGTGRLGIKDEELMDTLLMYVRQSLAGQEYLSLLSERLEEALRDFEYDYFTLNIIPLADDIRARIEIRGQGVHGDPPQRVGSLVLNVSGLEDTLNHALDLGITGEDAARRALDDWLDF